MRPASDVRTAFRLLADGLTQAEVAATLGVGQSTVSRWARRGLDHALGPAGRRAGPCPEGCDRRATLPRASYAYLLGQYLGDGHIAHTGRGVYRLFVCCCADYPGIIAEVRSAIVAVMPGNAIGARRKAGAVDLTCYSTHWPCLFPQHGPGRKHARPIVLDAWQEAIALDEHPGPFVRGLVHSDGCRTTNRIRKPGGATYEYTRYMFSNRSGDIRDLFEQACDRLGVASRAMGRYGVSVARRSSVAVLDEVVGPKA